MPTFGTRFGTRFGTKLGTQYPADGGAPSLAGLGASLLHHWEVPDASSPLITITGSVVDQLNDRVGGAHATASGASRPTYSAQYAPGNQPYLEMSNQHFLRATISLAAANRAGLYIFGRFAGVLGSSRFLGQIYVDGGASNVVVRYETTEKLSHRVVFTSGFQAPVINTPYLDQDWHLFKILPASTGAKSRIDNVTATDSFTGSSTVVASDRFSFGHPAGTISDGRAALALIVDDPTDAKDAIVSDYVAAIYAHVGSNAFVKAGQSNAYNVTDAEMGTISGYVMKVAAWGGLDLNVKWAPGSRAYNALVQTIASMPSGGNLFIWWVQGESDAQNPVYAPLYAANMIAFADAVESATGRSDIFWIDTLLHTSLTGCAPGDLALVNAGKTAFVATRSSRAELLDPTPEGSLSDGVHWNAALRGVMAGLARAVVIANP